MKTPAFADGNHLVIGAVDEEDRRGDCADLPNRVEGASHEEPQREERVAPAGEIDQRCRRPLENHGGRRNARRQVDRHRRPERPAVDDDRMRWHAAGVAKVVVRGPRIGLENGLGRRTGNATEPRYSGARTFSPAFRSTR